MQAPQRVQPVRADPLPPKYGSATVLARLAEIDAHRRAPEGVLDAEMPGHLLQQRLAVAVEGHGVDAEHALGGVVVRLQRCSPVLQPGPLRIDEELRRAAVQRAGIDDAAATDRRAAGDEHVLERRQPQDAAQAEGRRPHEAAQVPGAWRRSPRRGSAGRIRAPRPCSPSRSAAAPRRCHRSRSRRSASRSRSRFAPWLCASLCCVACARARLRATRRAAAGAAAGAAIAACNVVEGLDRVARQLVDLRARPRGWPGSRSASWSPSVTAVMLSICPAATTDIGSTSSTAAPIR